MKNIIKILKRNIQAIGWFILTFSFVFMIFNMNGNEIVKCIIMPIIFFVGFMLIEILRFLNYPKDRDGYPKMKKKFVNINDDEITIIDGEVYNMLQFVAEYQRTLEDMGEL